jgi:glycosyltransferase involved in cell wall biosynthesis
MNNLKTNGLYVIVPAYNEAKNIGEVLHAIIPYTDNIIVVDDGSEDNTTEEARKVSLNIIVVRHEMNKGKGGALRTGCDEAVRRGAKILALMDSDCQHLAEDMQKLVSKLIEGNFDIVFGIRKFNRNMPLLMKFGNQLLTFLVNIFSNTNLADTQSGLRVFTSMAYEKIKWRENNYSVETEMILNVGKNNLKYEIVGIQTIYREKYKGTNIIDGLAIFFYLLKWKLR